MLMFFETSDLRNMFWQQNLDNKILIFLSCFSSHVPASILESSKENDIFSNLKNLLYYIIIFQTCLSNFNSLSIETPSSLWNDLPIFYQGQISPKCAQIYVWPQKDDTYQYSISYSYCETILSLTE